MVPFPLTNQEVVMKKGHKLVLKWCAGLYNSCRDGNVVTTYELDVIERAKSFLVTYREDCHHYVKNALGYRETFLKDSQNSLFDTEREALDALLKHKVACCCQTRKRLDKETAEQDAVNRFIFDRFPEEEE